MRVLSFLLLFSTLAQAATFGTAVSVVGGATDLVLDEARGRLYIVNSTQSRLDIYTTAQRRYQSSIPVDPQPLSAAISRDGHLLYVTSYAASALNIVDLDTNVVVKRVSLPAAPEGVAVGGDERVLITTVGSGANNADNRLLLYDPNAGTNEALRAVPVTLPAPTAPTTPTSSRVFMSTRSNLAASSDGRWIIGLNNPNNTTRQLFVFEVASGTVLRSRSLTSISNVLAVSPDGSKFMAGLSLFDTETLSILAQQNTANALYPFANNTNFNTQQNQGGSVFAPDGGTLYSAFNVTPVQNPAARANVTELVLSDPDNLLINLALQLPENLTGNMVMGARGDTIYALSQSGFLVIPVSTMYDSPIAVVDQPVGIVLNDQCGVSKDQSKVEVRVRNAGKNRLTATATLNSGAVTFAFPIGGQAAGAGGGAPGQQIPVLLPVGPGGGQVLIPPGLTPGQGGNLNPTQQTTVSNNAPTVTTRRTDTETIFEFNFNSTATRSLGTSTPTDFLVQSPEAINIPHRVRVYQNNRNSEARGTIATPTTSISTAEALTDIVLDSTRQKLYIANSGMNRVEVFDTATNTFLTPIKVGQLPRSLALTPNNKFLYVANTGGESISVIDLDLQAVTSRVKFPPVPYNASYSLITPSLVAATLGGVQVVMSDGSLWKIVNDEALPRRQSIVIGTTTITAPRTLLATPGGEYALLLGGTGTAYLYDAMSDEYVLSQSVVTTPIQGYFGPMAAGPRGAYFIVNGVVLNSTLTPITTAATTNSRPIAAVAAVNATMAARFTQPVIANTTTAIRDVPAIELIDAITGASRGPGSPALEGPISSQTGTQRVNVNARTMAVDANTNIAYVLTMSGLSIIPITIPAGPPTATATLINSGGILSTASSKAAFAPNMLISIYGQNLAAESSASAPLPTRLGGTCVTLDESPIPLVMTTPGQINAQLPAEVKTGRHTIVVRAYERNATSQSYPIDVAKYAPAVFLNDSTGQAAIYHEDGSPVTNRNKADRDEDLSLFAAGLGVTTAGKVTDKLQVYFGDPRMKQSEMIVNAAALAPGLIGVYRLDLTVPGFRTTGENLPVTLRIGGVDSPVTATTAVE